jgi:hypothetical protein
VAPNAGAQTGFLENLEPRADKRAAKNDAPSFYSARMVFSTDLRRYGADGDYERMAAPVAMVSVVLYRGSARCWHRRIIYL